MSFCIFGFGSCGSTSETTDIVNKQFSKTEDIIVKKINTTLVHSTNSISNIVHYKIKAKGNIIIGDIDIEQMATLDSTTKISVQELFKSDDMIDDIIDSATDIALDTSAKASGILGPTSKSLTDSQTNLVYDIKKQFKEIIRTKTDIGCSNSILNDTTFDLESTDGSITISAINIKQTATVMAECYIDVIKDVISKIKVTDEIIDDVKKEETTESESAGLSFDIFSYLIPALVIILVVLIIFYFINKKNKLANLNIGNEKT